MEQADTQDCRSDIVELDSVEALGRAAGQLLRMDSILTGGIVAMEGGSLPEISTPAPPATPATIPAPRSASAPYATSASLASLASPASLASLAAAGGGASFQSLISDGEEMSVKRKISLLKDLADQVEACTNCPLHASGRQQVVFGGGDPNADLLFVGEGPGAEEDAQGIPFVGRSGALLTKMIQAMGLDRGPDSRVYIANVVKCRPPGNRTPAPDEAAACWGYLSRQIEIIQPKVIVVLGNAAAKMLLDTKIGITRLRGNWQDIGGIPVMPTFHPAYLLRQYTTENRKKVWSDLQAVMAQMDA